MNTKFNLQIVKEILIKEINKGNNSELISKKLGFKSRNSFYIYLNRHGIKLNDITNRNNKHDINKIIDLIKISTENEEKPKQFAVKAGFSSYNNLAKYLNKNGVSIKDFYLKK
jgi:hypothetical protein